MPKPYDSKQDALTKAMFVMPVDSTGAPAAAGTAGTPSTAVQTVQGITGGTPVSSVGETLTVGIAPAVTASAYSSGNCLGASAAIANSMLVAGGSALLHPLIINYGAPGGTPGNAPSGDLLFFTADPTAATPTPATATDKTGFAYGSSLPLLSGKQHVYASDFGTAINGVFTANYAAVGDLMKSSATTGLWIVFVLDGVSLPTPTATTVLSYKFKFIPQAN